MTSQENPDKTSATDTEGNATHPEPRALAFRRAREQRTATKEIYLEQGDLTVTIQRKSVDGLMMKGIIPRDLAEKILNMQAAGGGVRRVRLEDLGITAELQHSVLHECMVSPKMAAKGNEPDYDNDEIAITDLDEVDIQFIYNECTGASNAAAASFRNERES